MKPKEFQQSLMILGTCSGAGKSLMTAAICRALVRRGEKPLPFKGQNMSNNAWVDKNGGEMAYSQALQAWAAKLEPICAMNPILLKPKGDCTSEIIHLGRSVGTTDAETYYQDWFLSGWEVIKKGLEILQSTHKEGRLVLEGAGSPVEVNLQHRDLTNLRLAQFLNSRCLLVADIERGGVFAQIIGTLELLKPLERRLIKGILINRFRGKRELFEKGKEWIEKKTGIPVIGVMPWLTDIFPPEDSLDIIENRDLKKNADLEIAIIRLPSISNFSDLDPLIAEKTVSIRWIDSEAFIGNPDAVLIPGSKQTFRDLDAIYRIGLDSKLKEYLASGGHIFGICGGMQMLGNKLIDNEDIEGNSNVKDKSNLKGLGLLPIQTIFKEHKILRHRKVKALWPAASELNGFELHHGESNITEFVSDDILPLTEDDSLGCIKLNKNNGEVVGTYLHGIFDNGHWRRLWINQLRLKKGLKELPLTETNHTDHKNRLINNLADAFEEYANLSLLLDL